jgi:class 3 adenylate cyclase
VRNLPTGTVTFLFTDIEGSTRLLQTLGEGWKTVLEDHNRLVRDAILEASGFDLGREGDSFFAVFRTAPRGSGRRRSGAASTGRKPLASRCLGPDSDWHAHGCGHGRR